MHTRTLLLSPYYMPIKILRWQDAVKMRYEGTADVVAEYDDVIASPSVTWKMPAVMRLRKMPSAQKRGVKFSRLNVYQRDGHRCFAAGTMVLMADGRQLPIEQIAPSDRVIDAYGVPRSVVDVGSHVADNAVVLKHRGSFVQTMVTDDHPFLMPNGSFAPLSDNPELLVFPRIIRYESVPEYACDVASELPHEKWFRVRGGRIYSSRRGHEVGIPTVLLPSASLAYFLGLYVAEGSSVGGLVNLSFHIKEETTLAADASRLLAEIFGTRPAIDLKPEKNGCGVRAGSSLLALLLKKWCGNRSDRKTTPWALIGTHGLAYLKGLFLGDGCIDRKHRKVVLSMTSRDVVLGAQSILWGVGIQPTLQTIHLEDRKRVWGLTLQGENFSRFMKLVLGEEVPAGDRTWGDEEFVFRRVQQIEKYDGEVIVYNLEIDGSHTYIANGLAVHNCQYCGNRFPVAALSYDHVVPRSAGGQTTWTNIVTSCKSCNTRKASHSCDDAGMWPLRSPIRPRSLPMSGPVIDPRSAPEEWLGFVRDLA